MTVLTTYLCCEKMAALSSSYLSEDTITVTPPNGTRGQIEAKIIQDDAICIPGSVQIEAKIIEEDGNKYCNLFETGSVTWERYDGVVYDIKVTYYHPNHCHWYKTVLWVNGSNKSVIPLTFPRNLMKITWPVGGGECPESKDDVFPGGGESTVYLTAYWGDEEYPDDTQDVVPGDRINCTWYMWDRVGEEIDENIEAISCGEAYFSTDALTGGLVTAVNGEYGSEDITYTVEIAGEEATCVSSDFVEYAIDDWVIVQKSGNLILPLQIGSFIN